MYTHAIRLCLLAATVLLVSAPSASAASPTAGDSVAIPLGSKHSGLRTGGVKLRAIAPAKLGKKSLSLGVSDVSIPRPGSGQLILRGGLRLSKGSRKIEIRGFLVSVTAGSVKLTAKVGARRLIVFTSRRGARNTLDSGATRVLLAVPKLLLSAPAARAIGSGLGVKRYAPKSLGALTGGATAYFPPITNSPGESPADQQLWDEPALPTRPPGAVDATASALEWWVRDSWVNYVGQTPTVIGGASSLGVVHNDPSQGAPAHRCPSGSMQAVSNVYGFSLPLSGGWWDSASGTGVMIFSGGARFYYPGRFDVSFSNAELVITPGAATLNMSVVDADYPGGRRAHMFNVNTAMPLAGGPFAPGGPAALLQNRLSRVGSVGPFGGMYSENLDWGCIGVQFGT